MSAIHIVHVITGLRTGGAETMLAKTIEVMDRALFRHTVVALWGGGPICARIEQAGARVITLDMQGAADLPRAILKLRSILVDEKPCLVQTWLYHADFVGTIASRLAGVSPVLWNVRCSTVDFSDYAWSTRLVCKALAWMSWVPRLAIANSHTGRDAHTKLGYRVREWRIVPNGFDVEKFRPDQKRSAIFRTSLGLTETVPLIGLPARLDPMKDHETFLEAACVLAADNSDVRFVLVGKGAESQNAAFVSRIHRWGLTDRIHLLGERDDMEVVMAGLDIVTLCSSYGEGFPNVLGEALSCGALCAATDVGDSARVLGGHGKIVPPRQPLALAAAWRELLSLEPAERDLLASKGRQHVVEHYSLPAIGAIYENLFRCLAQETRSNGRP